MINADELFIVNYCHPNCEPFKNVCRLPRELAFSLAYKMAADNPNTTAFWRFADFENYYPRRLKTDEYLYILFISLGGKPKEKHPLSFVLQGSKFLDDWFGNGIVNKIKLKDIPSEFISFTLGDSMSVFKKNGERTIERNGELTMYTKEMLYNIIGEYEGTIDELMNEITEKYNYIEVQLWNDDYCVKYLLCP